jgi:NlpC/P60 family putative phage cell wall peptidase
MLARDARAISGEVITQEARSWIGTRFHHQGRVKAAAGHRGGCDCIGLVIGVAENLGITLGQGLAPCQIDCSDYGRYPDGKKLQHMLARYLQEIPIATIVPGDIILFRFEDNPQHVAIASDYGIGTLGIIHCYAQVRKVVEHHLDQHWQRRIVAAYRFPVLLK